MFFFFWGGGGAGSGAAVVLGIEDLVLLFMGLGRFRVNEIWNFVVVWV